MNLLHYYDALCPACYEPTVPQYPPPVFLSRAIEETPVHHWPENWVAWCVHTVAYECEECGAGFSPDDLPEPARRPKA